MQSKSNHYNVLKFVTTILVVLAHSSRMYTGEGVVNPINGSIGLNYLTKFIYSFHMPLFIAVSGMVYGYCIDDLNKYDNSIQFIKNKFTRLIIPFLFWGILYVAPIMTFFKFTEDSYIKYCINGILLMNNTRHLWYIAVLFEIFIICSLVKKVLQKRNYILHIFIFLILLVIAIFSYKLPVILQLQNLCFYLLFFYLGYLFNRYYDKLYNIINNPFFIIGMALILLLMFRFGNRVLIIIVAVAGSLSLIGITTYFSDKFLKNKIVSKANKNGFGIYLLHPMIIYILFLELGEKDINPYILCFAIFIISYGISWLITDLLRKIHMSIFIGE